MFSYRFSDVVAHRNGIAARRATRVSDWENVGTATCGPRGSPFQLPTRLADGLGHGSDLGHGYPRPFAPVPNTGSGHLGPPCWPPGRKANLGCIYCCEDYSHKRVDCQVTGSSEVGGSGCNPSGCSHFCSAGLLRRAWTHAAAAPARRPRKMPNAAPMTSMAGLKDEMGFWLITAASMS